MGRPVLTSESHGTGRIAISSENDSLASRRTALVSKPCGGQTEKGHAMKPISTHSPRVLLAVVLGGLVHWACGFGALAAPGGAATNKIWIQELQGEVSMMSPGATNWVRTVAGQQLPPSSRLSTGPNSRVTIRWSDQSILRFGAETEIEILPPRAPGLESDLNFLRGFLSFFHRDEPGRIRIISRGTLAGVRGTEFVAHVETVNGAEQTTFSVIDGVVEFGNGQQTLTLTNGQQATITQGQAPGRPVGFIVNNVLQWCYYYPAVLDLRDLPLTPGERLDLAESLAAYRSGDLHAALRTYPSRRQPGSNAERIYHATLLLSVGQVQQTEDMLARLPAAEPTDRLQRLANALRQLIAAVKRETGPSDLKLTSHRSPPMAEQLSTELLAASYCEQSRGVREDSLRAPLNLAWRAATNSPEFGFAWARVAELEFSFGRTGRALEALNKSLALAPRNAQALALKGFLLAAQNKIGKALEQFDAAIAADSSLGNAWLGRGLCRIRRGDAGAGREDLLVAAAQEPQRALLRSYLGKAYANAGDRERARHELDLARGLDRNDPTAWLYSALLNEQANRINEGIRDLEESKGLNENRQLYRSNLLLDQDQAVRSANLANLYRDAGMTAVCVREASRAVSYDYANFSSHLFLANSYDELRDPNRINLRYETPAESEYLIANLLAPVGAGALSQSISQQEYSKLFERDGFGVASSTEYLSRGAWTEQGAQYGAFGNSSYAFEALYRSDPGQRPNNDFESTEVRLQLKHQLTTKDSIYFRAIYYKAEGGDVIQYYDPTLPPPQGPYPNLRTKETQEPILQLGYHREWSPGNHTLLLAGRLQDEFAVDNPLQPTYLIIQAPGEPAVAAAQFPASLNYRSTAEIYSTELQQIWQRVAHNTIVGGRFQLGEVHSRSEQTDAVLDSELGSFVGNPLATQDLRSDFERWSFYGYHYWQLLPAFQLVGGLAYDWIKYPENFRSPPISAREITTDQLSPKAGFVWRPAKDAAVRFAYTRSLAGDGIDQTFLLEPSQVGGFNQSYRSIIPESLGGAETGAKFETFNLGLEQKFGFGTYVGVSGQILNSQVERTLGSFDYTDEFVLAQPSGTPDPLDYTEKSVLVSLNQLLGREWSLGAQYRLTHADLTHEFTQLPEIPETEFLGFLPHEHFKATLHQVGLAAIYNSRKGFFANFQAIWYHQSNEGYSPSLPDSDFWQLNFFTGYRFPNRKAELQIGLLNLTDQDYRLNPLTLYNELPRERTLSLRCRFRF